MAKVFEFMDYRDYLNDWAANHPEAGHGSRRKLADFLRCQAAFVSQVLHKSAHFTLEHAERLNQFLQHSGEESDYFLLLVQFQRAGSESLREYFRRKIEEIHARRLLVNNRVSTCKALNDQDKQRYYSVWYHSAIRLLLTIPEFRKPEQLARRLKLPAKDILEALNFLCSVGLAVETVSGYEPGELHLHLEPDSPEIRKHHMNWRLRALQSLEIEKKYDLHYSLGMTVSQEDLVRLKAMIVDFVESVHKVARPSEAQAFCGLCVDFFEP